MELDEILECTTDIDIVASLLTSYVSDDKKNEKDSKYRIKSKPIHTIYKEGIENYIQEPCILACKKSWDKNVFTKESIINEDGINIVYDKLSDENKRIFNNLVKKDNKHYCYSNNGDPIIKIKKYEKNNKREIEKELANLAEPFKIQDITTGYMTQKEFLMNICSCEKVDGIKEHTKDWEAKFVFDPEKVEKSFEEYLHEYSYERLYVPQEGRIYRDEFYLQAHNKFLNRNSF